MKGGKCKTGDAPVSSLQAHHPQAGLEGLLEGLGGGRGRGAGREEGSWGKGEGGGRRGQRRGSLGVTRPGIQI